MPVQSWAHQQYWGEAGSTFVPPPPGPSRGGYAGWQAGVVSMGPFGYLAAWWSHWRLWARQRWALVQRIDALPNGKRLVLLDVLQTLESPVYDHAKSAVRLTATTLGFNEPKMWVEYSRAIKSDSRRAENLFRHYRCVDLLQRSWAATDPSTCTKLSNPQKDLLAQLAYQEYSRAPWGD